MGTGKRIVRNYSRKLFTTVLRKTGKHQEERSGGYIVDFCERFIVLQESDDFHLTGYAIFPVKQIRKLRHNRFDKYYDKIMQQEGGKRRIGMSNPLELASWERIFTTLQQLRKNIIVECEGRGTFTIGPVISVTEKAVFIQNFDATGKLEESPSKIRFKEITKVEFDTRYIEVFSRYLH